MKFRLRFVAAAIAVATGFSAMAEDVERKYKFTEFDGKKVSVAYVAGKLHVKVTGAFTEEDVFSGVSLATKYFIDSYLSMLKAFFPETAEIMSFGSADSIYYVSRAKNYLQTPPMEIKYESTHERWEYLGDQNDKYEIEEIVSIVSPIDDAIKSHVMARYAEEGVKFDEEEFRKIYNEILTLEFNSK